MEKYAVTFRNIAYTLERVEFDNVLYFRISKKAETLTVVYINENDEIKEYEIPNNNITHIFVN